MYRVDLYRYSCWKSKSYKSVKWLERFPFQIGKLFPLIHCLVTLICMAYTPEWLFIHDSMGFFPIWSITNKLRIRMLYAVMWLTFLFQYLLVFYCLNTSETLQGSYGTPPSTLPSVVCRLGRKVGWSGSSPGVCVALHCNEETMIGWSLFEGNSGYGEELTPTLVKSDLVHLVCLFLFTKTVCVFF